MQLARMGRLAVVGVAAAALLTLPACGNAPAVGDQPVAEHDMSQMAGAEDAAGLAALRDLTADFGDIAVAQAAGYSAQITPCWYHRDHGAQGYHFGRPELIDGEVELLEPELVMYAPRADGTMEFLGVEYIVPLDAWQHDEPPALLGRPFMRNERLGLWVLHVWLGTENPSGLYADWNPAASCAHAAESEDRA
jgi:hypothetical protein